MEFTVGCDPEFFLKNGKGEFISAFGLFPGTKSEPHKLNKGAVQVDGTALEINIDPAKTLGEFEDNITSVLTQVEKMVKEIDPKLEMVFQPYVEYDPEYFALLPLDCKILGCDPDFDLEGNEKAPAEGLMFMPARAAGGHLHVGWPTAKDTPALDHFENCKKVARAFHKEEYFTPRSILEMKRVAHYGAPGSFRPKPYGVELRSPSNVWVARRSSRARMFNTVERVIGAMK